MTAERTDRELLEMAAKAAGLIIVDEDDDGTLYVIDQHDKKNGDECGERWTPLGDDGDALRLAVTLDIAIEPRSDRSETEACTWVSSPGGMETIRRAVPHGNDPGAATRRAIVLVAAALWEQIQANRAVMAEGG